MLPVGIEIDTDMPYPPRKSEFSAHFWNELAHGLFVTSKCTGCNTMTFPPKPICPHCWSDKVEWTALKGTGTLYSATAVHAAPRVFGDEAPYRVGIVDLVENIRLATRILDNTPLDQQVELVRVVYRNGTLFGARGIHGAGDTPILTAS